MDSYYNDAVINANAMNDLCICDHARLEKCFAELKVVVADLLMNHVRPEIIVGRLTESTNNLNNRIREMGGLLPERVNTEESDEENNTRKIVEIDAGKPEHGFGVYGTN